MATLDELKDRIDLHDLAARLGLFRPGNRGNYRSPHHKDKAPSLEIGTRKSGGRGWVDWSDPDKKGTCIDLVMYVRGCDLAEAIKVLHELYGLPLDRPKAESPREKSRAEYIAEKCLELAEQAVPYLTGRGITEQVVRQAIRRKALGFNVWHSPTIAPGQPMHGGPAVAFIVRTLNPGHVAAVDMRYVDPQLNGGVKTQSQGEKDGIGWTSDIKRIEQANTVYIVESAINALSIECCELPYSAAVALRGLHNVDRIDWRFLQGKRAVLCLDNDEPFAADHQRAGHRPGPETAWKLHEILTGLNVASFMVDQEEWAHNDVNDIIKALGVDELRAVLRKPFEPWLIPGLTGNEEARKGKPRLWLPGHDFSTYWRYRLKEDFTTHIDEVKERSAEEGGGKHFEYSDLCGFRVAAISRVTIASAVATMTGDPDTSPRVMFAVSVQAPRHGHQLQRRVVDDDKLHNIDQWKRFGPVFNQSRFLRMVNILERTAHIGSRKAANFVGLCYREGSLTANEGPDCYFMNPEQQCPYHGLTFPSGTRQQGREVLRAYQATFQENAAALSLVWALGAHLKAFLGLWPHMVMQATKGAGKSTFLKRLERSIAMTMFSGQSLNTEFRLLTSISHTSHPVGWEELSARRIDIIDKAVSLLQECYQYTINRRGAELTEFLLCAPVLLAGEDVPVRSLEGKVVRTRLEKKGPLMADDLPRFPVRQWIEFLATLSRSHVLTLYGQQQAACREESAAVSTDESATRMVANYAAVRTAWHLVCEFLNLPPDTGGFEKSLVTEMNRHITETEATRQPWVWIVDTLLSEIAAGRFAHPYDWATIDNRDCLLVRTNHVVDHLAHTHALREKWNGLPIKSDTVFKQAMHKAGVLLKDKDGGIRHHERTIGESNFRKGNRVNYLVALDLELLGRFGLHGTPSA